MGSLSSSALYFNITGPTNASWTAAGCTGTFTSFLEALNYTEIDLGAVGSSTVTKFPNSPKIYMAGQSDYIGFQFSGTLTNNRLLNWADSANIAVVIPWSLTTTSAASDTVSLAGVTSSSHCWGFPGNASASTATGTYINGYAAGSFVVNHAATSGMIFTGGCTGN
jgi:hypothetical protein